ncbi:fimbrillin family protein [Bacteroides sp. GD17]|jgi:hypothetical protein|uniref:fimbrillin family protein n=1 Tax=Bacteroides sp. GD17 TaxID=3139826 RepID=UPI0025CE25F3|nr:fimbrillin family protein [uncultured Bacteroides sp.]
MEKGWKFKKGLIMLLAGILLGACTETGDVPPPAEPGEPVTVSFVMYKGSAEEDLQSGTDAQTRAITTRAKDIPAGSMLRVYVYKAGSNDWEKPVATAEYTVQADGTATGEMPLYRGQYDFYLFSYNSSTDTPELTSDGRGVIDVYNGRDFMYNRLKGMTVQPGSAGQTMMQAPLTAPFKRMGTQVQVRVKANYGNNVPISPTSLKVNNIKVKGLPEKLSFPLGGTAWQAAENYDGPAFQYSAFTNNNNGVGDFRESKEEVLLPVNGSAMLTFTVNLTVGYNDGGEIKSLTDDYVASIVKELLPGMKYVFDFTLTFYGVLEPSDLTLAVRGYTETELPSDEIGK